MRPSKNSIIVLRENVPMDEKYYTVMCDGMVVGRNMPLESAMLFVNAMFEKYCKEPNIEITIMREE